MTDRIRVGVVGCGFFAQNHLHSWNDLGKEGAELVAICDVDAGKAKAAASKFAVPRWYRDAEAMLRDEKLGLVDIVTRGDAPAAGRARHRLPCAHHRAEAVRARPRHLRGDGEGGEGRRRFPGGA
jgi:hypothetical protein